MSRPPPSGRFSAACSTIEEQGGDKFFGEPMLNIDDLMQTVDGKGVVNVLAAEKLMNNASPLWLLPALVAG
jgi:DNA helicase HerA-like ATPase